MIAFISPSVRYVVPNLFSIAVIPLAIISSIVDSGYLDNKYLILSSA
ncbi:hypothetical protein [Clostridium tyrobutyricum]|nr:hypothetical protein [Clostridium tyrobutyricum]